MQKVTVGAAPNGGEVERKENNREPVYGTEGPSINDVTHLGGRKFVTICDMGRGQRSVTSHQVCVIKFNN